MGGDYNDWMSGGNNVFNLWSEFLTKLMTAGMGIAAGTPPPDAMRQARSGMFETWSQACDQFMRSPMFLEAIKQSMSSSLQFRKQVADFLGQVQHEGQGASRQDMDQIMRGMRHLEQRMSTGMERLSGRVEELHDRLDALEDDFAAEQDDLPPTNNAPANDRPVETNAERKPARRHTARRPRRTAP